MKFQRKVLEPIPLVHYHRERFNSFRSREGTSMNRLVAIALLSAFSVFAQTNRGAISGTITDQSQSVVPGATITILNLGTNETRKLTSGTTGAFSALDLDPVLYKVQVEIKGFKKSVVENVKVDTANTTTVNVTLQAGTVDTQVTV